MTKLANLLSCYAALEVDARALFQGLCECFDGSTASCQWVAGERGLDQLVAAFEGPLGDALDDMQTPAANLMFAMLEHAQVIHNG